MFNIDNITRANIRLIKPYSSARSEFEGQADIWLDANENPNETDLNRYQDSINNQINDIVSERKGLVTELNKLNNVVHTYPSETNFLLVEFKNSLSVFEQLIREGIVLRNRDSQVKDCLRITVGTRKENQQLLNTLETIQQ